MAHDADSPDAPRAAFEAEMLPHLESLLGLALRLTGGDSARSEDLVQDTFLRAWRGRDRYEPGTNARAWLMTILRNTFINEFRRRSARPEPVSFEDVADRPGLPELYQADPEGAIFDRMIDAEVVRAIEALPDEFRVVLVLSDVEGLAYAEIAEELDLPVGTVKSRLFRARRRLQRRLYEYAVETGYLR
jgi:RNA polymerase sigma-70 factor (ECF subfamily)